MDFFAYIILLGIAQGIFIGIVLFTKRNANSTANMVLGVFFIIASISTINFFLRRLGDHHSYHKYLFPGLFLFGPLLYYYVKSLTHKSFRFSVRDIVHFLPFILFTLYNMCFIIISVINSTHYAHLVNISYSSKIISLFQLAQIFFYIFIIKRTQSAYIVDVNNIRSDNGKIDFKLLNAIILALTGVFGLSAVSLIIWISNIDINNADNLIIPLLITFVIYYVGYLGIKQPDVISVDEEITNLKKYEKSTLTKEMSEDGLKNLLELMNTEKPFLDNEITLLKLANALSLSPHHLSQIINENLHLSFFDFINSYRIKEACKMLASTDYQKYTILAISMNVGFNSKSTFNTAFKKFTNKTPSEYKKQYS
jgi:AraC-like DNA-binding protein